MSNSGKNAKQRLGRPTLAMLPRIADSLSFLYLESVRIVQDQTGVCAQVLSRRGTDRVYLPTASLACVILGPGTSITQPALATFARHGTTLVCAGAGAVRSYAYITPASLSTTWLEQQARIYTNDQLRTQAATRMYRMRFTSEVPDGTSLAQLRGMEGQRVKALYRLLADNYGLKRFRRNYDPAAWDEQDPVNKALSAANTCLYGVVHAAIAALGCSPALGIVHSGTQHAFVYDIADLYKAKITIPLAFSLNTSPNPDRDARRKLREEFRLLRLLPTIVADIQTVLADDGIAETRNADGDTELVHLWDQQAGALPAGVNYGYEVDLPPIQDDQGIPVDDLDADDDLLDGDEDSAWDR